MEKENNNLFELKLTNYIGLKFSFKLDLSDYCKKGKKEVYYSTMPNTYGNYSQRFFGGVEQ